MLLGSDFDNLPDDDNLAFAKLEGLARGRADSAIELASQSEHGDLSRPMQDYMSVIAGLADEYNIPGLANWSASDTTSNSISAHYDEFRSDAMRAAVQCMVKGRSRAKQNTVKLDGAAKEKIRFHINQIRDMVSTSDLTDLKRRSVLSKLSALELEIDQMRTRVEFISSLAMIVADTGLDYAKKIVQVASIFNKAREIEREEALLPPPEEKKQIEGPKDGANADCLRGSKGFPRSGNFDKDLDDEIPF